MSQIDEIVDQPITPRSPFYRQSLDLGSKRAASTLKALGTGACCWCALPKKRRCSTTQRMLALAVPPMDLRRTRRFVTVLSTMRER